MKHHKPAFQQCVDLIWRRYKIVAFALVFGSFMGCGDVDKPTHTLNNSLEAEHSVFRMNLTVPPASLDPAFSRDQSMVWVTSQLYNGLVELDSNLRPTPALAKRWHVSEDGKVYTFHLRKDVKFHADTCFGAARTRTVTASDFVFSFTRICSPATASPGQWIFNNRVVGVKGFQKGDEATVKGFAAPNDSTFVVTLEKPFAPFLALLTMPYCFVVPMEAVKLYGKAFRAHAVGTGPYLLKRWQDRRQLILHRNPAYFEAGLPKLKAVSIRFIPNRLTALQELLRGNLDFIEGLEPTLKDELLTPEGALKPAYTGKIQLVTCPQLTTEYLGCLTQNVRTAEGHSRSPLLDVRVRRAIALALDREKLVRYLRNNTATPAYAGLVPMGMPGYDSAKVDGYRYSPKQAAKLLAEAGYPGGRGLATLTLTASPSYQNLAEFVQNSLAEVGIQVEIELVEGAAAREVIYTGKAHLWRASWVADYPDAENFLALLSSTNQAPAGPNTTRYSNPAYDKLYTQLCEAKTEKQHTDLQHRLERLWLREAPLIPLFYYKTIRLYGADVKGIVVSPSDNLLLLKYLYK